MAFIKYCKYKEPAENIRCVQMIQNNKRNFCNEHHIEYLESSISRSLEVINRPYPELTN